jgi:hypothetical protein
MTRSVSVAGADCAWVRGAAEMPGSGGRIRARVFSEAKSGSQPASSSAVE